MKFSEWLNLDETVALKGDFKGSLFQRLVAAKYKLAPTQQPEIAPSFSRAK